MQPAARVGDVEFSGCPLNEVAADDLWLVDLHLQGLRLSPGERLLMPNRMVDGLDYLRGLAPGEGGGGER